MRYGVVVTGASTGIGRAAAHAVAQQGGHAFAVVRKAADADILKSSMGAAVTPLIADVTDVEALARAAQAVAAACGGARLFGLVNNAGVAVPGPLLHLSAEDVRGQLEVNLIGVHNATQAFAPLLGTDPDKTGAPGRIVMISSVSGRAGMPFVGAYAASKHALEGYSDALRRELMVYGIDVIVIAPGAVKTPIWDKAEASGLDRFLHTDYGPAARKAQAYMLSQGRNGLPPEVIAARVWRCLTDPRPKTRYTMVRDRFFANTLPSLLPKRLLDGMVARTLGLKPGS